MASESSQMSNPPAPTIADHLPLSPRLKFLVSNLKSITTVQLSSDNFLIWKSQILKIFTANGFQSFLESSFSASDRSLSQSDGSCVPNPSYSSWLVTDQILSAAHCSTISASVLPYIISLDSTDAIWQSLATRFQSTNRFKVIQLKNSLHNISLKNLSMTQFLSDIKLLVDQIVAAGSVVDTKDIILYILNGLPASYQSFKTSIRTMLTPISLDQLYPLLLSEEINIASDASRASSSTDPNLALFSSRGRNGRTRGRYSSTASSSRRSNPDYLVICQIYLKKGHSAANCWHRMNQQFIPSSSSAPTKALVADSESKFTNYI